MKVHEFETLVRKLELRVRNSRDRLAWFVHEGKVITKTKRSHGSGELPGHLIRQQLKLSETELAGVIDCSLERTHYVQILTERGLIPAAGSPEPPKKTQS